MKQEYKINNYSEFRNLKLLYSLLFPNQEKRSFIEVGAYDGETNSKTACLSDLGWKGIYVEPVFEYFEICKNRHHQNPLIQAFNYAIDEKDGSAKLYKHKMASTLSEISKNSIEKTSKGITFGVDIVVTKSWGEFWKETNYLNPNVFVIDAEGKDWTILQQIDFQTFTPEIIFCEIFSKATSFISAEMKNEGEKIHNKLIREEYKLWIIEGHNRAYVKTHSFSSALTNSIEHFDAEFKPLLKQAFKTSYINQDVKECKAIHGILWNQKMNDFTEEIEIDHLQKDWDSIIGKVKVYHQFNPPTERIVELFLIAIWNKKLFKDSLWAFEYLLNINPDNKELKNQYILVQQILNRSK